MPNLFPAFGLTVLTLSLMIPAISSPGQSRNRAPRPARSLSLTAPLPADLVFQRGESLMWVEAGTTVPKTVVQKGQLSDPDLSPNGKVLAGTHFPGGPRGSDRLVATVTLPDGKSLKDIPGQEGKNNYGPRWSPDGTRLIWSHYREDKSQWQIAQVSWPGGAVELLSGRLKDQEDMVYPGWWEPDSQSVWIYDFKFAYRLNLKGEETKRVPIAKILGAAELSSGIHFDLAPDGDRLLIGGYISDSSDVADESGGASLIFLHDFTTAKTTRISPKGMLAGFPQWLPDGRSFLFEGTIPGQAAAGIYQMKPGDEKAQILVSQATQPTLARGATHE